MERQREREMNERGRENTWGKRAKETTRETKRETDGETNGREWYVIHGEKRKM